MHFRFKALRHCLIFWGVHFEGWEQNDLKRPRETSKSRFQKHNLQCADHCTAQQHALCIIIHES